MSLRERTEGLREAGLKALVPFFTAGYPDDETFAEVVRTASASGCRVMEIGIPFSDPMADGPVIQESSKAALAAGMTLARALRLARELSEETGAHFVFMSYINPLFRMGFSEYAKAAAQAGVTGTIIPDLPIEESAEIRAEFAGHGVTLVDLVAPTSGEARVGRIAEVADGFLYLVSLTGVTGVRSALAQDLTDFIATVRRAANLPLYVGFGVSTPDQAAQIAAAADGVIIGSALVRIIQSASSREEAVSTVGRFLQEVGAAMRANQE